MLPLMLIALAVCVSASRPGAAQLLQPKLSDSTTALIVTARPIGHFQVANPGRQRFGQLEFRGGLVLTGNHSAFGGWSGITIDSDGKHFLAISDEGSWMSGEIAYNGRAPSGITASKIGPIRALKGRRIDAKRDLDAEAVRTLDGDLRKGTVLIGFERNHRIGVFPVANGEIAPPTHYLKLPAEARRMRANKGFEAVAVLRGGPSKGSVVAFSERYPGDTSPHTGWIWLNGQPSRLALKDFGGFEITDAVSTDAGDLFILERRFRWSEGVKMRIRRLAAKDVKPGVLMTGSVLIEADMSFDIDNMEGLALHKGAGGELVLTVISDDNFNRFLQRNLLLQFAIVDERQAADRR